MPSNNEQTKRYFTIFSDTPISGDVISPLNSDDDNQQRAATKKKVVETAAA